MYRLFGKRMLDLAVTIPTLILLFPVFISLIILVRLKLGVPVFFRQVRPGLYGKPFTMSKFRTMLDLRDEAGNLLSDEQRLTPLGSFLRSTSLDELPELLHVLKGKMSLVGPRPWFMKYLPYYTEQERKRFEVLPGITGWAQVNGRNDLSWDERLACDVWYVENSTLMLDLKILWLTLWKVCRRENVRVAPGLTMLDLDQERGQTAL
jgi:sugar transferase EpsL